jgi:hypothetical protein
MVRGTAHITVSLVVLWTVTGCSSRLPVAEVEGIVKLGEKPLPHVRIQFMPDPEKGTSGPISSGSTDEQGRFRLVCADERPGAIVGWHRVVITDMGVRLYKAPRHGQKDGDDDSAAQKQKSQPARVPDKYTTVTQTPLSVEVKPEKQEMTLDLTR